MRNNEILLAGGLGNQLFQLAAGLYQAKGELLSLNISQYKSGPNILEFDLPYNVRITKNIKLSAMVNRLISSLVFRAISNTSLNQYKWLNQIQIYGATFAVFLYSGFRRHLRATLRIGYDPSLDMRRPGGYLIGYFQTYTWAERPDIKKVLTQLKLSHVRSAVGGLIEEAKMVKPIILHYRLGDYDKEDNFGILDIEYYRNGLSDIYSNQGKRPVWVFSNETKRAVSVLEEILPNEYKTFSNRGLSAAETFEIMRYGSAYLLGNSTFSWWAAFLSKTPNPWVVAPEPWFKNLGTPDRLILKNWTSIASFRGI